MATALLAVVVAGTAPAYAAAPLDDPDAGQPWVEQIAAPQAWDVTTGDASVVVGVVDTGVDLAHPDLAPNVWRNEAEAANGTDDDGDGLVDDITGWSFGTGNGDVADGSGHGTHVAGLIAARGGNGLGTAGVCWTCRILPVDVYREGGRGTLHDLASGMAYAADRARVVNLSLESPVSSDEVARVIRDHPDRLFVASAGNGGRDIDAAPTYPCAIDAPNVICVAADDAGQPAEAANWGAQSVDLAAPGVALTSTAPGGGTSTMTGSSFAAPLVSGTAALLWSWRPDATVGQVRAAILAGADPLPGWAGRTATGARLNAAGALRALAAALGEAPPTAVPVAPAESAAISASAESTSPVTPSRRGAAPLAVPARRASLRGGVVTIRLHCRSRTRTCTGTLRALGRTRRFAIAPGRTASVRFTAPALRAKHLRVLVAAGDRQRVRRVSVAR